MAGERTPDTTSRDYRGSSDDEISLREHLQRQLDSQRYHFVDLLQAQHNYFEQRLNDIIALLSERYDRQTEALTKAESAVEKRFDSVNEFRAQLSDQAHTFMPRQESISRHERTQEQMEKMEQHFANDINALTNRFNTMQGVLQGQQLQKTEGRQSNAAIYAAIGAAVTILGAIVIIANLLAAGHG